MYNLFFFLAITFFSPNLNPPPDDALATLKRQVIQDIMAVNTSANETMADANRMKADGSWADIDYTDKTRGNWSVNEHLVRLNSMAVVYKTPGTSLSGNKELADKILLGLSYWFKNDFICPNWWYPEIGVPKVLGPTMLLMEDKLSEEQKQAGLKILNRAKIGMTGQNKVWLSGNVIYRSLLTGNADSVHAAVKAIQDEVVVSQREGIQHDFSFHQHGPQQQFGNYGSSFAADMLKWASIFQGTAFQFKPEKVEIMRNYLLQGMRWIIFKEKMDISACGRQLFPNAQTGKAKSISNIMTRMPVVDAAYSKQYGTALEDFAGNIHFWRSDMTIHRRKDFYSSVRMSSRRVAGTESCNEENIQGYYLGDGATYFYQSGEEYTNIFPFWNWKMIPGITAFQDDKPLPVLPCVGFRIPSDFVGGVSDGSNGLATLAYKRDSLNAQKSWFFFDDEIVCMGAGIKSELNKNVSTTINQSFLQGNVVVKQEDKIKNISQGNRELAHIAWVIHDNWGYYFPGKSTINLANRPQHGDWHKVVTRMAAKDTVANMFTLWFDHHSKPSAARYAYYVFPSAKTGNIEQRAADINVLENSEKLQAVESGKKQMAGFIFVEAGEAKSKLVSKVIADKPCVLMVTKKSEGLSMSIADPTQLLQTITIGLQGNRRCKEFTASYDAGKDMTNLTIMLPRGPEAGKTVHFVIE